MSNGGTKRGNMPENRPEHLKNTRRKVAVIEGRILHRHRRTADRPGPQQHSWWKGSGMLQTPSTERRAAGGDRPRSGGSVMRPPWDSFNLATLHLTGHIADPEHQLL